MNQGRSFSRSVKDELARLDLGDHGVIIGELAGIVRFAGSLSIRPGSGMGLIFTSENPACARRYLSLVKRVYTQDVEVAVSQNQSFKNKKTYTINLTESSSLRLLLDDIGLMARGQVSTPSYKTPASVLRDRDQARAYIRGAFLGGGSVSSPDKAYHLEFSSRQEDLAQDLAYWLSSLGLASRILERKDRVITYIKDGDQVSDLLALMGASQSVLAFEDARALKDIRNYVNRRVNFETANLNKTAAASVKQLRNIELIESRLGLESLPQKLREVALLRRENPEASLEEIGQSLDPPVGKSGVSHRFKKIEKVAKELRRDAK